METGDAGEFSKKIGISTCFFTPATDPPIIKSNGLKQISSTTMAEHWFE